MERELAGLPVRAGKRTEEGSQRTDACGFKSLTSISLNSHFSLELTSMTPIFFCFPPAPWSLIHACPEHVGLVRVDGEILLCLQGRVEKCVAGAPLSSGHPTL